MNDLRCKHSPYPFPLFYYFSLVILSVLFYHSLVFYYLSNGLSLNPAFSDMLYNLYTAKNLETEGSSLYENQSPTLSFPS